MWQTMDTAPKDGTRILCWADGKQYVCRWEHWMLNAGWTVYLERKDFNWFSKWFGKPDWWLVAHPEKWQPLPPPPEV